MDEKTEGQKLKDKLFYKNKNVWEESSDSFITETYDFCKDYKNFLNKAKTEREFVSETEKLIKSLGFISVDDIKKDGLKITKGMKLYQSTKGKAMIICVVGNKLPWEGVNIVGAHIDSPRLDLKQNPLYEDVGMAMLDTHYYGGIKKYQWVTIPLSIHGVVIKPDGTKLNIVIGEADEDPVFTVTDLLPHLAADQMQKKMSEAITGEGLNVLFGSIPYKDEKIKENVKLNILKMLDEKYGMSEEDFISAEFEIVPAFKAKDVGLDGSMVGSYGQDDRVCAFTALKAILNVKDFNKTAVCVLTDKEEIGSMGNTGAESSFFENFMANLCAYSQDGYNDIKLRDCLVRSKMLSADVNAAVDPNYEEVNDKKNASYIGRGIILQKFTGARGKSGSSDANPEFIAELRKIFDDKKIIWQTGELGKVDQGGGGTIAQYVANLGVEVIDCGVAVLSMHAPFEVTSKIDIYTTYKAYNAFLEAAK